MKKRILAVLFSLLAVGMLLSAAGAQEPGETVTGYFPEVKYLRPNMVASADVLETIPAFQIVSIRVVKGFWGEYTSGSGVTGYLYFKEIRPVPEPVPCEPYAAYCPERQALRTLPESNQKTERRLEASQLITVDGSAKGFLHVQLPDGESGYVPAGTVSKAVFKPKKVEALRFCVGEETPALEMPLFGAAVLDQVHPGMVLDTREVCGDFYVLRGEDGTPAYVWKGAARKWSATDTEQNAFFKLPVISGKKGDLKPEEVYAKARITAERAELCRTEGDSLFLSAGDSVYVYSRFGGFCGVRSRQVFGYVRQEDLEIQDRAALAEQLRTLDLSGAKVERNPYLDQALPLLEEGNSFLLRYNAITGADLTPLFPLGLPYFWGGRNYKAITERWPEYTVREDWQSSSGGHYVKGHFYIYGFDCIGLVRHVAAKAGYPVPGDSVSGLGEDSFCLSGHHIWCSARHPLPEDWAEAAAAMEVGDILLLHYPGTHAMMYIGTLRDYGYTAEQLPLLADALDYPLMIQSGSNPYCYFRFKNMLDHQKSGFFAKAEPPDGGASVAILGVDRDRAEMIIEYMDEETRSACFEVEGTCVTAFSFRNVRDYFIYRETVPAEAESPAPDREAGALAEEGDPLPEETDAAGGDEPAGES